MRYSDILIVLSILFLSGCSISKKVNDQIGYFEGILDWRQQRLSELQGPESWPTLAGLYWLDDGAQTFGSSKESDIRFPENAPAKIGTATLENEVVSFKINHDVSVTSKGKKIKDGILWDMKNGISRKLQSRSLIWYAIKRGDKFAIRLKDTLHPRRINLQEIPNFPIQEKWVFNAKFKPAQASDTVQIKNQVGMNLASPIAGWIEFKFGGKKHRLTALKNNDTSYFIVFGDETNGNETYGGGRFLYPDKQNSNGQMVLDFNKAENPPCVFTDFATCPLPPAENKLSIAVKAGEKNAHLEH